MTLWREVDFGERFNVSFDQCRILENLDELMRRSRVGTES
jgi:hypothetical protein